MTVFISTIARAITAVLIIIAGWQLGRGLLLLSQGVLREGSIRSLLAAGAILVLFLGWRVVTAARRDPTARRKDN